MSKTIFIITLFLVAIMDITTSMTSVDLSLQMLGGMSVAIASKYIWEEKKQ